MTLDGVVRDLSAWWDARGYQVVLGLLVAVAVLLVAALLWSWRRHRVDRWVSTVTGLAVLGLSAEGMWVVARERLHLPVLLAASVFFVAEAALAQSALQATRHYERTSERDSEGRLIKPGTPGKHGRAVWIIATVAGAIVSLNSRSVVEALLRLTLPLTAAMLWWNSLTAEGTGEGEPSSWRWTPRRLLLALGAIEPGDRDVRTIHRERIATAMTVSATRYHAGGPLRALHAARLRRLARTADEALVGEVAQRVTRSAAITDLTAPDSVAAVEAAEHEVAELRAKLADLRGVRDGARGVERQLAELREAHAREVAELRAELAEQARLAGDRVAQVEEAARVERERAGRELAELRAALHGAEDDRNRFARDLVEARAARPAVPARIYTSAAAAPARVQAPVGDGDQGGRARLTAVLAQRIPADRVPALVDGERMPGWFADLVGEAADGAGITRKAALKYAREWAAQVTEQRSVSVK